MCGVAGFIGDFDKNLLSGMVATIKHRGPDGDGVWVSSNYRTALGHTRLSIQDLSTAGHQPMKTEDGRYIISYNGEVYNFKELRVELEKLGFKFHSHSDTEVVLKGLGHFGVDYLKQLNGIFALALYDSVEDKLILARDGSGVKPLYLGKTPKGYIFSSEMKALLLEKSLDRELSERAIVNYLSFLWSPGSETMVKSIQKVLPGEVLEFRSGVLEKRWFFYDVPFQSKLSNISEPEAVEKLDFLLNQAVERQMIADVPVGAFLSGGLDSSTLCYYASKINQGRLDCFTIDLPSEELRQEGITNDLPYARQVAEFLGVKLHTLKVTSSAVDHLEKMIYHLDEPQADPAILNTMFIAQLARENNIKVLLSGAGGDDIFTGYRRHFALEQEKYWSSWPAPLRHTLKSVTSHLPAGNSHLLRIKKAFAYADYPDEKRLASYFLWSTPERVYSLLNKERFHSLKKEDVLNPLLETLTRLPEGVSRLNQMLYLEQKHFLADHNLNYTDKMTMAYGVEARVPFLDKDLIDFTSHLPMHLKQNGRIGKYLLKKTMENYLPKDIIYRPKTGFGAPLRKWLKFELKNFVEDSLSEKTIRSRGIFDYDSIQKLVKDDREGKIDASYTIFALICLELWMVKFID